MSRPANPARWLRAGALGGSSVGLAAGAHLLGGGHVEPVFVGLLLLTATVCAHAWLTTERGLLAVVTAVVAVQLVVHLTLSLGHPHTAGAGMLAAHAAAAILLAIFLRVGEARLHAAARRRLTWILVGLRSAIASLPARPTTAALAVYEPLVLTSLWTPRTNQRRGPPAAV